MAAEKSQHGRHAGFGPQVAQLYKLVNIMATDDNDLPFASEPAERAYQWARKIGLKITRDQLRQILQAFSIGLDRESCEAFPVIENTMEPVEADAFWAWREWAEKREKETTWRRELSGTPGNMAIDQFFFTEGFNCGRRIVKSTN
jgi:hypothetical protein